MKWIKFKGLITYLPLAGIAIIFFLLPYYYTKGIEGFIKIHFYAVWLIGCVCWLWSICLSPIKFYELSIYSITAILYITVLTFTQLSVDDNSVFFLITFICLIGIIRYLRITFLRENCLSLFTPSIFASYLVQISIGFSQAITYDWASLSIRGQFSNSGFFANYLVGFLPFGLSIVLKKNINNYLRIGLVVIIALTFILLYFTKARSALVGCLSGACMLLFIYRIKQLKKTRAIIFLCCLLLPFIGYWLYQLKPNSVQGRLIIYRNTFSIIKDHLLTGVGPNRFSAVYNNYQARYFENNRASIQQQFLADNTFEAFNFILQILAEYGLIGFFLLLLITSYFLKRLKIRSSYSSAVIGSFASIVALLVSSLFSNPFHLTPVLLLSCYHISIVYPISINRHRNNSSFQNFTLPFIFILIFSFFVVWYSLNQYAGAVNWSKASRAAVYNDFSKADSFYKKAYCSLDHNGDFLFNYGTEACIGKGYELSIHVLERTKRFYSSSNLYVYLGNAYSAMNEFEKAEKSYLTSIHIAPSHIYPKYQLIQLYKKWGKPNDMKLWRDKTINFPIKVRSKFVDDLIFELKNRN